MDFEKYERISKGIFTASEANRKTKVAIKNNTDNELSYILSEVEKTVCKGKFAVNISGILDPSLRSKLEELGYKIKVGFQYNDPYYTISWE